MREMKDSGVEWIGEIPKDWGLNRAKATFRQRREKGNSEGILLAATQKNGMYPQDLVEGVVQVKEETDLQTFNSVHVNDFVISLRSFQGGFEISSFEGVCSPAYQVFYNIVPIAHGYYKYLFKTDAFISKINSITVGIREGKNIQYSDFSDLLLPTLDINAQLRIADYLDAKCAQIDRAIAHQQEVIEKLKEYKLSVITEAVTKGLNPNVPLNDSGIEWIGEIPEHWTIGTVGNATTKIGSGKTPRGGSEVYTDEGILFIRSQNVYETGLQIDDVVYVSEEIDSEMSITRVMKDDVLLNITGGSIGRACIYPFSDKKANVNQHVCIIRADTSAILPRYMLYIWNSYIGKTSIDLNQTGANREGMNFKQIAQTTMPFSPIQEQEEIVSFLDKICNEIEAAIFKKLSLINKLTEYKKSLIYEVVTGKREV